MKFFASTGAALLAAGAVFAQSPQFSITTAGADSVPQTTVVPVQQAPDHIVEHTTVYEEPTRRMSRTERRAYRAEQYAARLDSIVQSRNYLFYPNSMQQWPRGLLRSIYADYFFFGLSVDRVEVHLPVETGASQYLTTLNFDSGPIREYGAERTSSGWTISFAFSDGTADYRAELLVSTLTGETLLLLATPDVTMRYVGWLWDKRMGDPKFRRAD
ncbi:MAG: hypothetical protein NC209_08310 [Alistipes sp.]|nr:hypothetical protein [Alistipes senegalensis]MCM1251125.1 hypothetical protein [Alistipes sp.]